MTLGQVPLAIPIPPLLKVDPCVLKVMTDLWDPEQVLPRAVDWKKPWGLCISAGGYSGIITKLLGAAENFLTAHGGNAMDGQWDDVAFPLVRIAVFVRGAALDQTNPPVSQQRAEAFGDRLLATLGTLCVLRYAQMAVLPVLQAHFQDAKSASTEKRLWQVLSNRWRDSLAEWGLRAGNMMSSVSQV